jgi:cytochrome c oxidase cbb3-type subunit 3
MSVRERDPLTGHQTTGHEWNGITELNTRVPRAVWFFIIVTHVWALMVWVLLPTWPLFFTYTRGLLGIDQRETVAADLAKARAARAAWAERIAAEPVAAIREDAALMAVVRATAPALFGDNCAVCHGTDARGRPGFPSLVDRDWLWGGDPDTIMETLRVGINASHPETRVAQMLAFGRDGILSRDEIRSVVDYVQSLSGGEAPESPAGAELFAANCASCHGERGEGMAELGAPNLTDAVWIYGGDDAHMFDTVHDGRQGWMPSWEGRLSPVDRKILTVHLLELGEEQAQ